MFFSGLVWNPVHGCKHWLNGAAQNPVGPLLWHSGCLAHNVFVFCSLLGIPLIDSRYSYHLLAMHLAMHDLLVISHLELWLIMSLVPAPRDALGGDLGPQAGIKDGAKQVIFTGADKGVPVSRPWRKGAMNISCSRLQ